MKRSLLLMLVWLVSAFATPTLLLAAEVAPAPEATKAATDAKEKEIVNKAVGGTTLLDPDKVHTPDFLEQIVDLLLEIFNVPASGNTATHYGIAAVFLVGALVLRRVVIGLLFRQLKRIAARTS